MSILFVDAYDSFTRNIIALLYSCIESVHITVVHIDTHIDQEFGIDIGQFLLGFDAVVLGPGPGDPRKEADVGVYEDVWTKAACYNIPVLGICLGFQALCLRYGLSVSRMREPCHGQTKQIRSLNIDIFENVSDVVAMNYNSLAVKKSAFPSEKEGLNPIESGIDSGYSSDSSRRLSNENYRTARNGQLRLLAWDDDGYVMAVRHANLPFWGFQFHPESCMSNTSCHELIRNWWLRVTTHNTSKRCSSQQGYSSRSFSLSSPPVDHQKSFLQSQSQHGSAYQPQLENVSKSQPRWVELQSSCLSIEHLSSFCYDKAGPGAVAMLESSAKGRYCIYTFIDDSSETIGYMNGQLVRHNGSTNLATLSCSPKQE